LSWYPSSIKGLTFPFQSVSEEEKEDPFEKDNENLLDKGSILPHLRKD
jgi:hypothetical protein